MKFLLPLLLLLPAGLIHAQKRIIFIEPGKETSIHVNPGDSFMIQSIMTAPRGKKALPYIGRALGAGLLTYGAERAVQTAPGSKETSGQSERKSLWPAIGAGVAINLPDALRVHANTPPRGGLQYYLYNKESALVKYDHAEKGKVRDGQLTLTLRGKASSAGTLVISGLQDAYSNVTVTKAALSGTSANLVKPRMADDDCTDPDPCDTDPDGPGCSGDPCSDPTAPGCSGDPGDPNNGTESNQITGNIDNILTDLETNGVANYSDGLTSITFNSDGTVASYNGYTDQEIAEDPSLVPDYVWETSQALQLSLMDNTNTMSNILTAWANVGTDPYQMQAFLQQNIPNYSYTIMANGNIAVSDGNGNTLWIIPPGGPLPMPLPTGSGEVNGADGDGNMPPSTIDDPYALNSTSGTTGIVSDPDNGFDYYYQYDPGSGDWNLTDIEPTPGITPTSDPCTANPGNPSAVTTLLQTPAITSTLSSLVTDATTASTEYAFSIEHDSQRNMLSSPLLSYTTTNASPPETPSGGNVPVATVHSHPVGAVDQTISAQDLQTLLNSFVQNPAMLTAYCVSGNDGSVTAFSITNLGLLTNWLSEPYNKLSNIFDLQNTGGTVAGTSTGGFAGEYGVIFSKTMLDYETQYAAQYSNNPTGLTSAAFLAATAYMLNIIDIPGISMYQANTTTSSFQTIYATKTSNSITIGKCPN
jgi:hypothetical protein